MPLVRGIQINVISQWELKVHPEFSHPDDNLSTTPSEAECESDSNQESPGGRSIISDDGVDIFGRYASASVYIPSVPGAKFWLTWLITDPAIELSQWYYFKLFLNGRHVTSWGTNSQKNPSGQVMRGLFEPSDRWNYKSEGIVYKNMGTESRPFIFMQNDELSTAATDGGVMEVKIYRAHGRRRKVPEPTDFKSQEPYGIAMATAGLLERPEEAKFYDWHLKDALDEPYAVTRIHYRSWNSLHELSLIPEDHSRELLSPTPSIRGILGISDHLSILEGYHAEDDSYHEDGLDKELESEDEFERLWDDVIETPLRAPSGSRRQSLEPTEQTQTAYLSTIFDHEVKTEQQLEKRSASGLQYENAPMSYDPVKVDLTTKFSAVSHAKDVAVDTTRQLKRVKRKSIMDRPLPEIPNRSVPVKTTHSRLSSTASTTNSITPSLRSYIERRETSPEPVLITATTLSIEQPVAHQEQLKVVEITPSKGTNSYVSLEPSPPLTSPDVSLFDTARQSTSPSTGAENTSSSVQSSAKHSSKLEVDPSGFDLSKGPEITVRKHRRNPRTLLSRLSISGSPFKKNSMTRANNFTKHVNADIHPIPYSTPPRASSLNTTISEGEWMCRTPSPQKTQEQLRLESMWSPTLGDNGKHRPRRDTESTISKPFWRGTPDLSSGIISQQSKSSSKSQRSLSSSRDRLASKAMEWYVNIRSSKDHHAKDVRTDSPVVIIQDNKVPLGWI